MQFVFLGVKPFFLEKSTYIISYLVAEFAWK